MKVILVAGNGLSLSMLSDFPESEIDLLNLFRCGADVPWPADGMPGFLSYEHCPNLWALGARPNSTKEESYQVIEKIITAVNACCMADPATLDDGIYIRAYKELVAYLRYLFVYYDNILLDKGYFKKAVKSSAISLIKHVEESAKVDSIDIVTFNYDAMLERCLNELEVEFSIPKIGENHASKLALHKPHGSITFCGHTSVDSSAFEINYSAQFTEGGLDDICVRYDALSENYPMVGMLPPAGESERYKHRWIREVWDSAIEATSSLDYNDLVILYGLSYWHVDRKEVDYLLANISRQAKVVSVNPYPNEQFDAVCCSLFRSYHSYSHPRSLSKVFK